MSREAALEYILDHFHKDSCNYGGWPLENHESKMSSELVLAIMKEFDGIIKVERVGSFIRFSLDSKPFKLKHTVRVLRRQLKMYRDEANKYYNGMKKLIGE